MAALGKYTLKICNCKPLLIATTGKWFGVTMPLSKSYKRSSAEMGADMFQYGCTRGSHENVSGGESTLGSGAAQKRGLNGVVGSVLGWLVRACRSRRYELCSGVDVGRGCAHCVVSVVALAAGHRDREATSSPKDGEAVVVLRFQTPLDVLFLSVQLVDAFCTDESVVEGLVDVQTVATHVRRIQRGTGSDSNLDVATHRIMRVTRSTVADANIVAVVNPRRRSWCLPGRGGAGDARGSGRGGTELVREGGGVICLRVCITPRPGLARRG